MKKENYKRQGKAYYRDSQKRNIRMPKTALTFKSPLQLLVSTVLSAQCTDVRVNMVTKELFKKYRSAKRLCSGESC